MNVHLVHRHRAPLSIAAALSCLLAASSPAIGAQSGMLFEGAGFGPTIEVAVQSAFWDAEASASAYQLFTCRLVGEPRIFPGPNPTRNRNFRAQVTVACTP
ncbi:hypothetical protein RCO27_08175 [Sphingosinicella sp. LHD-64]|uniref:hypothetical protein n=1 Tax=Sphingosinicella sp. LHD-64 TaxID=3072139 RepID=UPI00280E17E2|nr:hypothetical protein [Sphingosinicella sp. LHD-64]MDQ8756207.1 hypothetical protein [Sphingosinicella sp. LHD-64]